jgi:hypothetical protein
MEEKQTMVHLILNLVTWGSTLHHYGYFINFLAMFNYQNRSIILKMCYVKNKGYEIIINFVDSFGSSNLYEFYFKIIIYWNY